MAYDKNCRHTAKAVELEEQMPFASEESGCALYSLESKSFKEVNVQESGEGNKLSFTEI